MNRLERPHSLGKLVEWKQDAELREAARRFGCPHSLGKVVEWKLRDACKRVGLVGVSTHSFRRTALTMMSSAGVPLRHIQEIHWSQQPWDFAALLGSYPRATEETFRGIGGEKY